MDVAASSLASHIAVPFLNGGQTCQPYSDFTSGCTDLYLFYAACFAAVVVPLTCMDLTEQTPLQIALACLRFVAVAVMVTTSASAIWYSRAKFSFVFSSDFLCVLSWLFFVGALLAIISC